MFELIRQYRRGPKFREGATVSMKNLGGATGKVCAIYWTWRKSAYSINEPGWTYMVKHDRRDLYIHERNLMELRVYQH